MIFNGCVIVYLIVSVFIFFYGSSQDVMEDIVKIFKKNTGMDEFTVRQKCSSYIIIAALFWPVLITLTLLKMMFR